MATAAENLRTAYENFAAKLAEISEAPKPSYSIDGQSVSWVEYYRFLTEQMKAIRDELSANDPVEEISEAF